MADHFFTVDVHTHILPSADVLPDLDEKFGYSGFIKLQTNKDDPNRVDMFKEGAFFRTIECNCWDPNERIRECNEAKVDVQVLSTVPVMFSYWARPEDTLELCRMLNDDIARTVATNPKRFVGLGTLPMNNPNLAIEELRRCINELGFSGVQIGSHVNNMTLADPEFFPIFEEAERLGACIFVHPWDMVGSDLMKKYWLPWLVSMPAETTLAICSFIFGGIFERLPNLRVLFAHGGGSFPGTIGRIEHGHKVRPDLCAVDNPKSPREYCGKFWVDSIIHDQTCLNYIADLLGKDKIAMGSDYPFPLGEHFPPLHYPGQLIRNSSLSDHHKRMMLGYNALNWLGISLSRFDLEPLPTEDPEIAQDAEEKN